MPSPSQSLATQRPDLATFLEFDLESDKAGFIASTVFPVMDVASQAGNFGRIPLEQLLQERQTLRAPGSGYARGDFTFEPATYACVEHGAEEVVDDRQAKMYREYFDAETIHTMRAFSAVLRNAERRVAAKLFNDTTWTGANLELSVNDEWDDFENATPIDDIAFGINKIYDNSGLWANALIVNRKVFKNLRRCEQVIERIESQGAGDAAKQRDITAQMLAMAFDLDYVIVAGASRNAAKEGQPAAPQQIWSDDHAMVCKIAVTGDMAEPCIGRTFHWSEDGSSVGGTVESYRQEDVRGGVIRVRHDVDEYLLYKEAGFLLSDITT